MFVTRVKYWFIYLKELQSLLFLKHCMGKMSLEKTMRKQQHILSMQWNSSCHRSVILFRFRFRFRFSSVAQSCLTLYDPMDCSTQGLPVHHQLPEFTQTHVHWTGDAIQPSHPLSSPSPPAFNPSQHQGLFQWVSSSHQVAKVLEFQLQHQSFQWIFRFDFL